MKTSRNITNGWYHSALRVLAVCFATVLIFESGILSPATKTISHTAGQQIASTIGATTEFTPYSVQQIQSESAVDYSAQSTSRTTFLFSTILFIILLLLVLNYILVHLRNREIHYYLSQNT